MREKEDHVSSLKVLRCKCSRASDLLRAGKMVQLVMDCEHKWGPEVHAPRTHIKSWSWWYKLTIPALGRQSQECLPRDCLSVSLAKRWAPGSLRDPASKNKGESDLGKHPTSTFGLHSHVHPGVHTPVHGQHIPTYTDTHMYAHAHWHSCTHRPLPTLQVLSCYSRSFVQLSLILN